MFNFYFLLSGCRFKLLFYLLCAFLEWNQFLMIFRNIIEFISATTKELTKLILFYNFLCCLFAHSLSFSITQTYRNMYIIIIQSFSYHIYWDAIACGCCCCCHRFIFIFIFFHFIIYFVLHFEIVQCQIVMCALKEYRKKNIVCSVFDHCRHTFFSQIVDGNY